MASMDIILRLDLRGRFEKGDKSVGEGDGFEDIEIEDAWIIRTEREGPYEMPDGPPRMVYREVKLSILNQLTVEARNAILEALDQDEVQEKLREDEG